MFSAFSGTCAFKRKRKKLVKLLQQVSHGQFEKLDCSWEEAVSLSEAHKSIPCVDTHGIPHILTAQGTWEVSPEYLAVLNTWQNTYEPIIQMACIEAAANGLEIVRIYKKTGETSVPRFSGTIRPLPGNAEREYIKKIVREDGNGDVIFEEDDASYLIRWDDYD